MAQPDADARKTLREVAEKTGTPLLMGGEDWRAEKNTSGFRFTNKNGALDLPAPALAGEHQFSNAGLAIAALQNCVPKITSDHIAQGLRNVAWPARLQRVSDGAFASILPKQSELWLDGGHNDSAGEILARQAEKWRNEDAKPLHLICGMLTTKHPAEFLTPLRPYIETLQTIVIEDEPASFAAEDLAHIAHEAGIKNAHAAMDAETAIRNLMASSPCRILICGSLYLAGQILKKNNA
jgi:dihydrofolate synthase/folylpolyglutamate synthase